MTTGNREDYLINILRITEGEGSAKTTELAAFMGVSPASVSEMLKALHSEGLVEYAKYKGVGLTEKGLNYARQIRKKHHIMERFLTDILDVDEETAHNEACKMEHVLSDESAVKICQVIGTDIDCDCQSCADQCKAVSLGGVRITAPLSDIVPGGHGVVSHIRSEDPETVKRLLGMGMVPGREVRMDGEQHGSTVLVHVDGSLVALDKSMASAVFVDASD
ncbi:MAG: metal-dependent transcriptional regulator [Candidatus Methanoplasma sp.]|jgi:DtxR family Mn-dependent transcriptional regulator|nr:metal-dependent transcriptional regulator [Candidatus Methanoplasma sp.]